MPTYIYPDSARLMEIEQDLLPRLINDDPIFQLFPITTEDDDLLRWEQKDNFLGLQQVRGYNGQPPRVARVGAKGYLAQPGIYGEFVVIDEREITKRRRLGTFGEPIDISALVLEGQEQLLQRRIDRMRQILWTLVASGTFSVASANGVVMQTDTYPVQTASAAVTWATHATATPLVDLRAVKLKARGHSVSFGRKAQAFANSATVNDLLENTNASDIGGKRIANGATFNSLSDYNRVLLDNDLPQIVEYDEGYLDDSGVFQLFVPNNKVAVVGMRGKGAPVGEYRQTRNASNPGAAPGPYMDVIESEKPPKEVEVHDGVNGGPVIFFPSAVVVLTV
jgi:hypothetical protein